ncbi:mucin-5AC isoform X11 [Drosophila rhopaloa]|uniref:Chitin-binding type-2 domain-containing protein n=1 Tax=Drosophila rhopaloa TaxID=1041015 RepID=A0ABM5JB10_DRORH|nr:mucin-5AC isoform X11 [Drosophila rhopaloa]
MEYLTCRPSILCLLGLCILLFKTELTEAQGKRASRVTSSRSFGTNVKPTSSNGLSFDCPEEFGYYPHPSDCTQYYVCVFGGALLESCTGGLMYSHELQTCDWPRNVGCELVDTSSERDPARSQIESQSQTHTQAQQQQHVPSRVRFGAAFGSQGGTQKAPTVAPQYHRSPPQVIQAQVQHVPPPPPALRVPPNPVITSRGQPKPLIDSQEEIAKLYAEAQETLPPVEEEESDRQQRVYRGQPSTVSQVQRDRDGIIHQASINAIPQAGKIGSYAFGTAYRAESSSPSSLGAPEPANIFVQPTSQAPLPQLDQNRNFYNASIFNHGGGGYQPPQQQQQQQQPQLQPTPFQQAQPQQQQHQQRAQAPPHPYDSSFYSVYDDDIDLYRDIEYQQQQEQQQPVAPQYQPTVRQQQPLSTYRPLELSATPTPPQKTSYGNQPTLTYSSDYDEDINAQIEQENVYDQSTRSPQSSKAHANKQHVPNKSKTTSTKAYSTPNTTTPPTNPSTYSSNPFLKSKLQSLAQSLASFVSHSLSRPNNTDYRHVQNLTNPHRQSTIPEQIPNQVPAQTSSPIPPPSTTQWPLVKDSSGSNQQDPVETVFDESQNIHVQTAEPPKSRSFETNTSSKFLDFINAAAYGTSPRGNLLNSVNSDIPYRERGYSLESNSKEPEPQRKRIQTYITSDVEPHSFRIPANGGVISPPEEIDTASTTRPNKPIQYSLQSGSHGFSLRVEQNQSEGNASEPIFSEKKSLPLSTSTSTSTTTELSEDLADIIPTTYAPPLRIWRNGRPTIQQTYYRPTTASATTTTSTSSSTSASTTSNDNVGSSSTLRTTTTQKALAPPSTERYIVPGVGYTARANYFKDSLNRVTANPAARFVSPYKSLENLLQEDRQHQHHQLRTTARPRLTNAPVFPPFLQTTSKPPKNLFITTSARNTSQDVLATMATGNARNFSVSDAILSTFSPQRPAPSMLRTTTTTTTTTSTEPPPPEVTSTITAAPTTTSAVIVSSPIRLSQSPMRPRGRSRYTAATLNSLGDSVDEPTTYAPKFRLPAGYDSSPYPKRKPQRVRVFNNQRISFGEPTVKPQEKYEAYKAALQAKDSADGAQSVLSKSLKRKPIDNEASILDEPRAEALVSQPLPSKLQNSIEELSTAIAFSSTEHVVAITDRPTVKFLYSNKYRQQTAERTLAESLQNAGYITSANGRAQKFRSANVLEQLRQFLAGSDSTSNSDESGTSQFVDEYSLPEIKAAVNEVKHLYLPKDPTATTTVKTSTTTPRPTTTPMAPLITTRPTAASVNASERQVAYHAKPYSIASTFSAWSTEPPPTARTTPSSPDVSTARSPKVSPTPAPAPAPTIATATPSPFTPPTARGRGLTMS